MIAIITALPEELAPLLRRAKIERVVRLGRRRCHLGTLSGIRVVLLSGGDALQSADESASELLQRFDVSLLIGAGIGGAVDSTLRSGDVVVASEVRAPDGAVTKCEPVFDGRRAVIQTLERVAGSVAGKRELGARGAQVIDTESAGWARAASRFKVPFAVVRAIFDAAEEKMPEFPTAANGSIDRAAVVYHALLHPSTVPGLLQLRERLRTCAESLADFVSRSVAASSSARLHALLIETSRTFALCIPLLDDATRLQITIAYLLFRVADTFEDASHWPVADRLGALEGLCRLLRKPDAEEAQRLATAWHARVPSSHAGYMNLIAEVPRVIHAFTELPAPAKEIIRDHVIRSAQGMAKFVARTHNGELRLADLQQLRAYCYAVAGIVGEMLTELFLLRAPELRPSAPSLRARAAAFGEGLQLVNILKDAATDAAEGRNYLPPGADRAKIIALARIDLESAIEYILSLQDGGAPEGIVAFAALPVALARPTLDRMEKSNAGAKIGRPEVFRIARRVRRSVARGQAPLRRRSETMGMRSKLSLLFGMR